MAQGFTDDTGLFISDLHGHATVIYSCMSQALNHIASHRDDHADCHCTDLLDAALYIQAARDRLMQDLVQGFDDQIAAQDQQDDDEYSSDNSAVDSDDQVNVQGSPDRVEDNVD